MKPILKTICGQPSWILRSDRVELAITQRGGHLAPVTFDRKGRAIRPFHVNPWWNEKVDRKMPKILQVLRGDFFCFPFGANTQPFGNERHPLHGETANGRWQFVSHHQSGRDQAFTLKMPLHIRRGLVTKRILLRDGEDVVYQDHIIEGMQGLNCPGHHPSLEFRSPGHIAVSPFLWGSTYPWLIEPPEAKSYCGLKTGVQFRTLKKVPLLHGGESDLSLYPSRRGLGDVVQIVCDPRLNIAWNTVAFPEEGWLYFALKDPKVLRQTVLWFSNGGRYSPPWNGRHENVLGLEDVTSYFAEGLALSAKANPWTRRGIPTALRFDPKKPTSIRYIMGIARIPSGFQKVRHVRFERNGIVFLGKNSRHATARVDWSFLHPA